MGAGVGVKKPKVSKMSFAFPVGGLKSTPSGVVTGAAAKAGAYAYTRPLLSST